MILDDGERPGWRPQRANPISEAERLRLARAYAAKRRPAQAAPPAPTVEAASSDPCSRCGVPGSKGCAHWLPYAPPKGDGADKRSAPRMSTAWGHTRR